MGMARVAIVGLSVLVACSPATPRVDHAPYIARLDHHHGCTLIDQILKVTSTRSAARRVASADLGLRDDAGLASNGWAIGKDRVERNDGGLLLANPHFPWG